MYTMCLHYIDIIIYTRVKYIHIYATHIFTRARAHAHTF